MGQIKCEIRKIGRREQALSLSVVDFYSEKKEGLQKRLERGVKCVNACETLPSSAILGITCRCLRKEARAEKFFFYPQLFALLCTKKKVIFANQMLTVSRGGTKKVIAFFPLDLFEGIIISHP